jgi:hypothetical protein
VTLYLFQKETKPVQQNDRLYTGGQGGLQPKEGSKLPLLVLVFTAVRVNKLLADLTI